MLDIHIKMKKLLLLILFLFCTPVFAANYPLEITNIKPAGTGEPAIPTTNRIFRAYPGIEYNIRAAVIGGDFPYYFTLTNAPSGMTIDSATGEITWTNPQSNSGTITLTVEDSEQHTTSTTWAITVQTSEFWFVDDDQSGGGHAGTYADPFESIQELIENVEGSSTQDDIVYFRAGNYTVYDNTDKDRLQMDFPGYEHPFNWIAYPGETVNIDCDDIEISMDGAYLDRLNFSNMIENGVNVKSDSYKTVRRCTFTDIDTATSANNNQGMLRKLSTSMGYYFVIQDNEFSDYVGANAIGSLYSTWKMLIEDNYFHDGGTWVDGYNSYSSPIGIKEDNYRYTIRHNKIILPAAARYFGLHSGHERYGGDDEAEFCFNFLKRIPGDETVLIHSNWTTVMYFYRNTFDYGVIEFRTDLTPLPGPFYFDNNVRIDITFDDYAEAVFATGDDADLVGVAADNIIDSNGELQGTYATTYYNLKGWEYDPYVPSGGGGETTISVPAGLTHTIKSGSDITIYGY